MVYNLIMTSYKEFKESQGQVSNQDFAVVVVDSIFEQHHVDKIYEIIDNASEDQTRVQPWASHKVWDVSLGQEIEDRINEVVKNSLGNHLVLKKDYSFARYSPKFGYRTKLFPHYDTRPSQRVTFDIQLKTSEPWALVVEEDIYNLQDNQALVFAGTQQVHWREDKQIADNAEIDMVFCHLEYVDDRPLDDGQEEILRERANFLINKTGISNLEEQLEV
jgi:hypothetical protein